MKKLVEEYYCDPKYLQYQTRSIECPPGCLRVFNDFINHLLTVEASRNTLQNPFGYYGLRMHYQLQMFLFYWKVLGEIFCQSCLIIADLRRLFINEGLLS